MSTVYLDDALTAEELTETVAEQRAVADIASIPEGMFSCACGWPFRLAGVRYDDVADHITSRHPETLRY